MRFGLYDSARNVFLIDSADNVASAIDWRTPIINYLRNPVLERAEMFDIQISSLFLMNDELYR
jgi:hypothetical protein